MNILKDNKGKIKIVKLSKLGFMVLVVGLISSYFIQTFLFSKIKELELKKNQVETVYDNLHEFKYFTELLLTSYDLEIKEGKYKDSFFKYEKSMETLLNDFEIDDEVKRGHKFVKLRVVELFSIFNQKMFTVENHMYKPLLVRLGEMNRTEDKSDYYLIVKEFFETINHLKQYQEFLLEDLLDMKNTLAKEYNSDIENFNKLFTFLPIVIIVLAILFSIIINKVIDEKEKTIINTQNLLEKIMNSVPARIFWKDKDGHYLGANNLFLEDARLDNIKDLVGKSDFELTWKEVAQNYVDDDREVMNSKKPKINIVETQVREDGTLSYLNTSKVPLFDENNDLAGVIGLYADITQQYEAQKKIEQQEMQLVHQNRLAQMGEMISMIAHQWRQPLTVISSTCATLMLKTAKNDFNQAAFDEKLNRITLQTRHLSETIEDFRSFFKPGKKKNIISSSALINDTIKIIEPTLKQNNITIEMNFCCEKELNTYGNEVKQVILNILKNANDAFCENSVEKPLIKISAACNKDSKCRITINDNAGGINKDIINNIFDPYFSTKSEKNGTGLGLYMSKMIIEDHCEGKLEVESQNGETTFYIVV